MTSELEGKTVVISGAARGQGRAHAVEFARAGASIIALDICGPVTPSCGYPPSTPQDLQETVAQVRALGVAVFSATVDVRERADVARVVREGSQAVGEPYAVVANAAVTGSFDNVWEVSEATFRDIMDVNLFGAWNTICASLPWMLERQAGSVVAIASGAAPKGSPNIGPYVASKNALIGLMHTLGRETGPLGVRVNTILPGNVGTPMLLNESTMQKFVPHIPNPTVDQFAEHARHLNPLGVAWVDPVDIAAAAVFLSSERARYVTGQVFGVDAGALMT